MNKSLPIIIILLLQLGICCGLMFKAPRNFVQIFSQGIMDILYLLSACLVVPLKAYQVNSNTMLVESWMLLIIKLPELHFLRSKLVSATTVERGIGMSHCLHKKYQCRGKNTRCESKAFLNFCPDRVAFPLPAAAYCGFSLCNFCIMQWLHELVKKLLVLACSQVTGIKQNT